MKDNFSLLANEKLFMEELLITSLLSLKEEVKVKC